MGQEGVREKWARIDHFMVLFWSFPFSTTHWILPSRPAWEKTELCLVWGIGGSSLSAWIECQAFLGAIWEDSKLEWDLEIQLWGPLISASHSRLTSYHESSPCTIRSTIRTVGNWDLHDAERELLPLRTLLEPVLRSILQGLWVGN